MNGATVMDFLEFSSRAEMEHHVYLAQHLGIHVAQAALGPDSTWVRFPTNHADDAQFGKVLNRDDLLINALLDGHDPDGATAIANSAEDAATKGLLQCRAYDTEHPEGWLTAVHMGSVWPIPYTLFAWLKAMDFEVSQLSEAGRTMLNEAYLASRGRVQTMNGEQS